MAQSVLSWLTKNVTVQTAALITQSLTMNAEDSQCLDYLSSYPQLTTENLVYLLYSQMKF